MIRIGITVQQADGHGVELQRCGCLHNARHFVLIELDQRLAIGTDALFSAQAMGARHEGVDGVHIQIVDVLPVLPADLEHIFKAGCGH